jgi:hypothetical protein
MLLSHRESLRIVSAAFARPTADSRACGNMERRAFEHWHSITMQRQWDTFGLVLWPLLQGTLPSHKLWILWFDSVPKVL